MTEEEQLIKISKFAGERFDLVQAGGGNSSVKSSNGQMLIKASGCHLSEVGRGLNYAIVDNERLKNLFSDANLLTENSQRKREDYVKDYVQQCLMNSSRPSIETTMHSLLGKYTLHTHSLTCNLVLSTSEAQKVCQEIYPEGRFIPYKTPGIEVALEIEKDLLESAPDYKKGYVAFLQNHGLIVSADDADQVINLTLQINRLFAEYTGFDISRFESATQLSMQIRDIPQFKSKIIYPVQNPVIENTFREAKADFSHFCPDTLVYCGRNVLRTQDESPAEVIQKYIVEKNDEPVVLLDKSGIVFIMADSVRKAKDAEDLLLFYCIVRDNATENLVSLSEEEQNYLRNWEAEKYRQSL